MSPTRDDRGTSDLERSTRDALMDAALEQIARKGVLAGLNLHEVADSVGITPANIYHLFGSREALLRAAISRESDRVGELLAQLPDPSFVEGRSRVYELVAAVPVLRLTALLALDGDPGYKPMPFFEETRDRYRARVEAGELPEDLDTDAVHLLSMAASIGAAIYGDAAARQLGVPREEVISRTQAVLERMLRALTVDDGA